MLWKRIIIKFTPYQTTTLTKLMFSQKPLFKSSLLLNCQCGIQVRALTNSDDICLPFCLYPSSLVQLTIRYGFNFTLATPGVLQKIRYINNNRQWDEKGDIFPSLFSPSNIVCLSPEAVCGVLHIFKYESYFSPARRSQELGD